MTRIIFIISLFIGIHTSISFACTNLLVTKGASSTGSCYILYTNDGEWLYQLQKYPAKDYKKGEFLKIGNGQIAK